jgi:hypothetical protein
MPFLGPAYGLCDLAAVDGCLTLLFELERSFTGMAFHFPPTEERFLCVSASRPRGGFSTGTRR